MLYSTSRDYTYPNSINDGKIRRAIVPYSNEFHRSVTNHNGHSHAKSMTELIRREYERQLRVIHTNGLNPTEITISDETDSSITRIK